MTNITNEIREKVNSYLQCEDVTYEDDLYAFYYRCMENGMDYADADRYAILNTLLNYDIGMENAERIDSWMYLHDDEIYELGIDEDSKKRVELAVKELGLDIDFGGWITEDYKTYKFFE